MSNADRQRAYRARRTAGEPPVVRKRVKPLSRPRRWNDAVNTLIALQEEYQIWLDNLPESLHDTNTAEKLQAVVEVDLEALLELELPRGFGRD